MLKSVILCSLLTAVTATSAIADTKVGDWEISRNSEQKGQCLAVRSYVDKEDHNLNNSIVLSLLSDKVIMVLAYQGWNWDKGDKEMTSLSVNDHVAAKKVRWEANDSHTLTAILDKTDTLKSALSKGNELSIKFDDGSVAEFHIPKAGDAMVALQTCVDVQ